MTTMQKVGDRVMVYMLGELCSKAWKLAQPYHGPYRILSLLVDAWTKGTLYLCLP